jgi:membrane dipeptidase
VGEYTHPTVFMMIVDAHLDLAFNAVVEGRAVDFSARNQRADADGIPSVGLPDLTAGGVKLICATIFCEPGFERPTGYNTADEANVAAIKQLDWYRRRDESGLLEIARSGKDLHAEKNLQAILLMEGADPIRHDGDLQTFWDAGLRIVGLAWKRTRFAGGTKMPGPLTEDGVKLVKKLDRLGAIHDLSHLAEESFWQLLELAEGPVMASHSNCRAIVPTDRQLSDEMIRATAERRGVIGINFYDKFLLPPEEVGKRRANLGDVVAHVKHICDLLGDATHVGLGTDMDGGFGREKIPVEIETSADLPRVGDALNEAGFSDLDVERIMSKNWVDFFRGRLPG